MIAPFALTIPEAVAASRMSRSAIYQALRDQSLRGVKAGRRTLIPTAELERFISDLPAFQAAA